MAIDSDSITIILEYCDTIVSIIGLTQWDKTFEIDTSESRANFEIDGPDRKDFDIRALPDGTERRPCKRTKRNPLTYEQRIKLPIPLSDAILAQFAKRTRSYLQHHYGLDDKWWSILSNRGGYLSGSFLFHFLHGVPERANDLDFYFLQTKSSNVATLWDDWLDKNSYKIYNRDDGDDGEYTNIVMSAKYKCGEKVINIIIVDTLTVVEHILGFDFSFLMNTYDGQTLFISDTQAVLTKTSNYHSNAGTYRYTKSAVDQLLPTFEPEVKEAARFCRCVKYIEQGCMIPNFQLPTHVINRVRIHERNISLLHHTHYKKMMLQWICAYNDRSENANRKIVVQHELCRATRDYGGTVLDKDDILYHLAEYGSV
jgi:hypothetical protein